MKVQRRLPPLLAALLVAAAPASSARVHDAEYAAGTLGLAPIQSYHSSPLTPPDLNLLKPPPPPPVASANATTSPPLLTLIGFRGSDAVMPAPMILDDWGELIWAGSEYGSVLNVQRNRYRGEEVLSFYTGTEQYPGYGNGQWNLLDKHYEVVATVEAQNTTQGLDPHDLYILDDIATVEYWTPVQSSLEAIGGSIDGWVYDCRVQSINITTGELLFEWSSLEHVPVEDTYYELDQRGTRETSEESPFDYFHLNSVQRDEDGNYLLGARGVSTVYYVDGRTGEILWRLGGRHPSFLINEGVAFWFQHDARVVRTGPETMNISLFDNGANQYESRAIQSRGIAVEINTGTMEAQLLRQVLPPFHDVCPSEGSVQTFEDGRIMVGWGIRPYYTEFDANDHVLHDVQFGTDFSTVHSYRAFKSPWTGYPRTRPSFVIDSSSNNTGYISWNGATEVETWRLLGGYVATDLVEVSSMDRTGFETALNLNSSSEYVAVAAYDSLGGCLGVSEVLRYDGAATGMAGACPTDAVDSNWRYLVAAASFFVSNYPPSGEIRKALARRHLPCRVIK